MGQYISRKNIKTFWSAIKNRLYPTDKKIADYIVAKGTTNGWTWRKWDSGIAECEKTVPSTSININLSWNNVYYATQTTQSLPTGLFKYAPDYCSISWNGTSASGNDWTAGVAGASGLPTTTATQQYAIYSGDSRTVTGSLLIKAIGVWK